MTTDTDTDTAHAHWDERWASADGRADWLTPEPDVAAFAGGLPPGSRCLDLGCGVGRHALMLARMGHAVAALDAAPAGLAQLSATAEAEGLSISTERGRMAQLPFETASIDYVLAFNVIYHGDDEVVARTLSEIARVLRPGGHFQGTLLSDRNANRGLGREVAPGTWADDSAPDGSDKAHPHFFCNGRRLLDLFEGFEPLEIADRPHSAPGSWHWHAIMERR